jgi:hypothetical protein
MAVAGSSTKSLATARMFTPTGMISITSGCASAIASISAPRCVSITSPGRRCNNQLAAVKSAAMPRSRLQGV